MHFPTYGPPFFMGKKFPHGMSVLRHPQQSLPPWLMHWHNPKLPRASFREKPNNGALYLTLCAVGNGEKTNGLYFTT